MLPFETTDAYKSNFPKGRITSTPNQQNRHKFKKKVTPGTCRNVTHPRERFNTPFEAAGQGMSGISPNALLHKCGEKYKMPTVNTTNINDGGRKLLNYKSLVSGRKNKKKKR